TMLVGRAARSAALRKRKASSIAVNMARCAMVIAIHRASSFVIIFAADLRPARPQNRPGQVFAWRDLSQQSMRAVLRRNCSWRSLFGEQFLRSDLHLNQISKR